MKYLELLQPRTWTMSERKISTGWWNNIQAQVVPHSLINITQQWDLWVLKTYSKGSSFQFLLCVLVNVKYVGVCLCSTSIWLGLFSFLNPQYESKVFNLLFLLFLFILFSICVLLWWYINRCMCAYSCSCVTSLFTRRWKRSRVKHWTQTEISQKWRRYGRHAGIWQTYSCSVKL